MEFAQDHEDVIKADKVYCEHKGDQSTEIKYKEKEQVGESVTNPSR
jgi:hypothetical protein